MEVASSAAEAILQAGRRVIAERGPDRLNLSEVAATAGVSRPTLYRWFPTRADLLAAISVYEEHTFDVGLEAVVAAHRGRRRRLDAALRYIVHYLDASMMPNPIDIDPGFALGFLAESLERHVGMLAGLLDDALLEVPAVRSGTITKEQAAEIFLRMAYSHYLVPHRDAAVLLRSLLDLAGLPRHRGQLPEQAAPSEPGAAITADGAAVESLRG